MATSKKKTIDPNTINWNADLVPQESWGLPGKTYPVPANAVNTTSFFKENKTKRFAGMQGPGSFDPPSNKELAIEAATWAAGGLASKVASKVAVTALKPVVRRVQPIIQKQLAKAMANRGQRYALHVSHEGGLSKIKDIPKLRDKGLNKNTGYIRSEQPGTYGFDIEPGNLETAVKGSMSMAGNSSSVTGREGYSIYVTKANPISKGAFGRRIRDPEYSSNVFTNQGESIYGSQKVIKEIPVDVKKYTSPYDDLMAQPNKPSTAGQIEFNEAMSGVQKSQDDIIKNITEQISNSNRVKLRGIGKSPALTKRQIKEAEKLAQMRAANYKNLYEEDSPV